MSHLRVFGKGSVAELLDDFLIFRNLIPVDKRLPGFEDLHSHLNLPPDSIPRKLQPAYGLVVAEILRAAMKIHGSGSRIQQLIYIGDTKGSDGAAFRNIRTAGNWKGAVFIAGEKEDPASIQTAHDENALFVYAERWQDLYSFTEICQQNDFNPDDRTAVILDLDKTTLGARGRNDQVINQARVAAVTNTVQEALGDSYDEMEFEKLYQVINKDDYHFLTEDNQDFIAYICIMIGSGLITLDELLSKLQGDSIRCFSDFVARVDQFQDQLSNSLGQLHQDFSGYYYQGDPTPMKEFRYQEYLETIQRMGKLNQDQPISRILAEEITLTAEVYQLVQIWREQGLLIFGLSDKPDEASVPSRDQIAAGLSPIHQVDTLIVGTGQD
jgi:hypothetical protein